MKLQQNFRQWFQSPLNLILITAIGILSLWLIFEHSSHLLRLLPYTFLLLCPVMHFFMHGGHEHEQAEKQKNDAEEAIEQSNRNCH